MFAKKIRQSIFNNMADSDSLFDEIDAFDSTYSSNNKDDLCFSNCFKLVIFIFIIYLLLNSNIWCQHVVKGFNMMDDMDNISLSGHLFNALVISVLIILLIFLISKDLL